MSSSTSDALCERCGRSFTPRAELLERYPGWVPKRCPTCYRASRDGAGAPAREGSAATPNVGAAQPSLTLADVLLTYDGGPDDGVFTDGSASPNPGPGGWGAVYVVAGEVVAQDHGAEAHTTNNRMELTAILRGIELVPRGTAAVVYSDSNLAVRTINEWASGWQRRGWRRKTGAVENLDLVRPLYEAMQRRPELELRWIKAHVGNRWNEYADSLASAYTRDEL